MKRQTEIFFYLIIVIKILIIQSCNNCNNRESYHIRFYVDEENKKNYDNIRNEYPKRFVDHLPDLLDEGEYKTFQFSFPIGEYVSCIHLIMQYSDRKIKEIRKYAEENSIEKHYFNDSCLMMIAYKNSTSSIDDSTFIKKRKCDQYTSLPLPNFTWCIDYGFSSNSDFYKNATIYILGAEQGEFLEYTYTEPIGILESKHRDERLLKSAETGLPAGWEHGYTKGMVISGKYVFYWLNAW
jgi:hypothetical protein